MKCQLCGLTIHAPFVGYDYFDHVCCLLDAEMSHTHDHRAEPVKTEVS